MVQFDLVEIELIVLIVIVCIGIFVYILRNCFPSFYFHLAFILHCTPLCSIEGSHGFTW